MNRTLLLPALYLSFAVCVGAMFYGALRDSNLYKNLEQRRLTIESISK